VPRHDWNCGRFANVFSTLLHFHQERWDLELAEGPALLRTPCPYCLCPVDNVDPHSRCRWRQRFPFPPLRLLLSHFVIRCPLFFSGCLKSNLRVSAPWHVVQGRAPGPLLSGDAASFRLLRCLGAGAAIAFARTVLSSCFFIGFCPFPPPVLPMILCGTRLLPSAPDTSNSTWPLFLFQGPRDQSLARMQGRLRVKVDRLFVP